MAHKLLSASTVTDRITLIAPIGAPALVAASMRMSAMWPIQIVAEGCGLSTMAQRALMAIKALKIVVYVGLVEGTMAATTPNGSAISTTLRASSRLTTPTVLSGLINRYTS